MTLPRSGAIDPRWIGGLALLVLLAAGLARGVYTVGPESVGVMIGLKVDVEAEPLPGRHERHAT